MDHQLAPFQRYYHSYSVCNLVSTRQLKLQATCDFQFMCRHIVDNTSYISRGMGVRKVLHGNSDRQGHPRSLSLVPFDRSRTISSIVIMTTSCIVSISETLSVISQNSKRSRNRNTFPLKVIYHARASTGQCQCSNKS